MPTLGFKATKLFFDRPAVISAVDRATLRQLSTFGRFVRRRARSSIRKRKKVSKPGEPPSSHKSSEPNLRTIFYAYEPANRSVIIGPVKLDFIGNDVQPAKGTRPELLEEGGDANVQQVQLSGGRWVRPNKKTKGGRRNKRTRRVQIKARPFMGPAFQQEFPQAAGLFQDQI